MAEINFYILSADKPLMPFICQLTQTVLHKSHTGLIIICPTTQLTVLDNTLWAYQDTAFIPHQIINDANSLAKQSAINQALLTDTPSMSQNYQGIFLNLTDTIINNFQGNKLLEIITQAPQSLSQGRIKYRHYRQQFGEQAIKTYHIA